MSDLVEFLLARIAEDAETAGGAWRDSLTAGGAPSRWEYGGTAVVLAGTEDAILQQTPLTDPAGPVVTHAARWDPRRVLAECEAKRRIVEQFTKNLPRGVVSQAVHDFTLGALALPYADHPDYRDEWRVG